MKLLIVLALAGLTAALMVSCLGLSSCDTLKHGAKDLLEERLSYGVSVDDITNVEEVSRTEKRVECKGRAKLDTGFSFDVDFYEWIDEDGDVFHNVRYDTFP